MKPIRIITLALVLALCAFSAPTAHAQIGTTCTITGTVYQVDGITPAAGATLTVTRADKSGKLYANTSRVYSTNSNGIVSFKAPRTVGTDTAVIHVKASFGNLASGQILYVPSDSTATLESLVRYTANPTFVVVAVPTGGGSGDTSLNGHPRLTRIENVEGQFTSSTSDSLQQVAASVYVARNVAEGKANADSVHTVLVTLSNLIAGKGGADSIHTALVTLYNLVAGKPSADSVHTAIAAMLKMSDTTALHAQRFAVINDSLLAVSLRATTTANDLVAHAATADAHLPSQTGASGKFLQSNGTVSSWQAAVTTESDPTAIPRTDSTRFVSRTAPQIPGLASPDTNTVIGVDASGNLVLRKDDAGTGGSSIDSNRIVRHDIKAPKVAATVGAFDSLVTRVYRRDTLTAGPTVVSIDSMDIEYTGIRYHRTIYSGVAAQKLRTLSFTATHNVSYDGLPYLTITSDSSAGWRIIAVKVVAWSLYSSAPQLYGGRVESIVVPNYNTYTVSHFGPTAGNRTLSITLQSGNGANPVTNSVSPYRLGLVTSTGNNAHGGVAYDFEVTVGANSTAAESSWFAKLID